MERGEIKTIIEYILQVIVCVVLDRKVFEVLTFN